MDFHEINRFIRERIGRKVVVLGACTGTDAHTVGIDAIMNMKGYKGEYGLERYPEIEAHNLGSQVSNEELVARALESNADALLVSQVVTQKGVHITNLTELVELVEAEGLRDRLILICGGPRIHHELALELGYDAGFGPGTLPPEVASFIVQELVRRRDQGRIGAWSGSPPLLFFCLLPVVFYRSSFKNQKNPPRFFPGHTAFLPGVGFQKICPINLCNFDLEVDFLSFSYRNSFKFNRLLNTCRDCITLQLYRHSLKSIKNLL